LLLRFQCTTNDVESRLALLNKEDQQQQQQQQQHH
jgi:hypothetical protein